VLQDDPLVSDLPSDSTLIEIQSQIAVEYGQSISLYLDRPPLETIKLAVVNKSTIKDLKIAIGKVIVIPPGSDGQGCGRAPILKSNIPS